MARYRDSVCRLCRREAMKLFLKGERCYSSKCAIERRGYAPGQHGQRQRKVSDYGVRLREKQKVKRIYGLMEVQFKNYFFKAERMKGITGEILIQFLERRLDNVVYRCGFAGSRQEARQMVQHGHFKVNGKRVNIPSYQIKQSDQVQVLERSRKITSIKEAVEAAEHRGIPSWLELEKDKLSGRVVGLPGREEAGLPIKEQLIVELYSK